MKRRLLALLLCLSICGSFCGCKHRIQSTNVMKDVKAVHHLDDYSISEYDTVAATDFSIRLFQKTEKKGTNTLLAPLSILPALSMTANGACGDTLTQMERTIGIPVNSLNQSMYSYTRQLTADRDNRFHLANSIWLNQQSDLQLNMEFLQKNANWYNADIYRSDFDKNTLEDMNAWVSKHTDEMIPSICNEISKEDVMYLINAISFDSKWSHAYEEHSVQPDLFTHEDGKIQEADYMLSQEYEYLESATATGFLKPYAGYTYAFAAILPKEGISLSQYIHMLSGKELHHMLASATDCPVYAAIPKFQTHYEIELSEILKELVMKDAFDQTKADFTDIGFFASSKERLFINKVMHKSFLSVAEKGTTAGAATSVSMEKSEAPATKEMAKEVTLNRPFLYMIIDYENRFPIFIGTAHHIQS